MIKKYFKGAHEYLNSMINRIALKCNPNKYEKSKTKDIIKNKNKIDTMSSSDIDEDLSRLGNDWKSDVNQQEESKIEKNEYEHEHEKKLAKKTKHKV